MKKLNVLSLIMLIAAANISLSASCNRANNRSNESDSISTNAYDTTGRADKQIADFKKTWNQKIDELGNKIDRMGNSVDSLNGEKKEQARIKLNSLKAQRTKLKEQVDQAANHAGAQWDQFKQSVSNSYDSLSAKIKNAFSD